MEYVRDVWLDSSTPIQKKDKTILIFTALILTSHALYCRSVTESCLEGDVIVGA